jgi:LacI family transcriptional regulator
MPGIKDVAKEAGVGLGTVSRVLNNSGSVKQSTRKKVEAAIEKLNYKPNEVARSFKRNQTHSVALILPTLWHPFYSKLAHDVEQELYWQGYKMIVCNAQNNVEKEKKYISMLENNKIDGIIAITYSKEIDQYITSSMPIISIDRHFTEEVTYVSSDHEKGGRLAFQAIYDRGSRNPAFFGSKSPIPNESSKRIKGFLSEAAKAGSQPYIMELSEPVMNIEKHIETFLVNHPQIDGVFAMNDKWAEYTLRTAETLGRHVPGDLQIVGFDGVGASKDYPVSFSTIVQQVDKIAQEAVRTLIAEIKEEGSKKEYIIPVKFQEGYSTKSIDKS